MSCACRVLADPVFAAHVAAPRSCACDGIGDLLPTIVWPGDVTKKKQELDPHFVTTNAALVACSALPAAERAAWSDFFAQWRRVFAQPEDLWGLSNQWDEVQRFGANLRAWQERVAGRCSLNAPELPKPPEEAGSADVVSAIKVAAAAIIVAATVYGVTRFV